jgi:hypothetical protein
MEYNISMRMSLNKNESRETILANLKVKEMKLTLGLKLRKQNAYFAFYSYFIFSKNKYLFKNFTNLYRLPDSCRHR